MLVPSKHRSAFERYRDVLSILGGKEFMVETRLANLVNISYKPFKEILANLISIGMVKKIKISKFSSRHCLTLTPLGLETYNDIRRNQNMLGLEIIINKVIKRPTEVKGFRKHAYRRSLLERYLDVFSALAHNGSMPKTRLMHATNLTMDTLKKILTNLLSHDMIREENVSSDRRIVNIVLLPLGIETYKGIEEGIDKYLNTLGISSSESEVK